MIDIYIGVDLQLWARNARQARESNRGVCADFAVKIVLRIFTPFNRGGCSALQPHR